MRKQGPDFEALVSMANQQRGFITASQAKQYGFSAALCAYHVRRGAFVRIRRGLLRLPGRPSLPKDDYIAAWLSLGRDDAVLSHESALVMHGLRAPTGGPVHMTVARPRRRADPKGVILHTSMRFPGPAETTRIDGAAVTLPARSIVDFAAAGGSYSDVAAAAKAAIDSGAATVPHLLFLAQERSVRVGRLVKDALGFHPPKPERASLPERP